LNKSRLKTVVSACLLIVIWGALLRFSTTNRRSGDDAAPHASTPTMSSETLSPPQLRHDNTIGDDSNAVFKSPSAFSSDSNNSQFPEISFERDLQDPKKDPESVMSTLVSDDSFDYRKIAAFANEARMDPDANALTELFREALQRSLVESDLQLRSIDLVCGLEVCLGLFAGGTEEDYWRWVRRVSSSPELPGITFHAITVTKENEEQTIRFWFLLNEILLKKQKE